MRKKIFTSTFLVSWIMCFAVLGGDNIMKINNVTVQPGSVATIEMEIINEDPFAGFNVDIPLPAGFSYIEETVTLFRSNGHYIYFSIVAGNVARVISFAIPTTNFSGNEGVVMTFDVQTPNDTGTYTFSLVDAVISNSAGANIITESIPGIINLQEPGEGFNLDLTVILEGPYMPGKSTFMHTALYDASMLPLAQPYAPVLPYYGNNSPVWYYEGDEAVGTIPAGVVDWVLVELRDAPTASQALITTVVARQAAFLLNTGKIVTVDGSFPTFDLTIQDNLFAVVYHRNHLAVMSSGSLTLVGNVYTWDFTIGSDKAWSQNGKNAWQQGHKHLGDGVYGLYGGDGDANGQIQTQDKNDIWNQQSNLSGYLPGDFDMNGQVQTQDKNNIWNPNSGKASQLP